MAIREIEAKSILRRHRKIDSWFISHYGMNLYRGCVHDCIYCDGRSEKYRVEGEFGKNVVVKVNAVEVLRRELDPTRRRVPLKRSYLMLGGGVGDSYQPVEEKYQLTRRTLQLILEFGWPVHVLTKSILVERDMDLIKKINEQNRAIVSFSFSSADDETSLFFEPNVPPPSERLETIARFKREGVACGMFLLPVIPFVTDTPEYMEDAIRKGWEAGVDFVIFGGMTMKQGRQEDHFLRVMRKNYPDLIAEYEQIYGNNEWGRATSKYNDSIHSSFKKTSGKYKISKRIPPSLFGEILSDNDLVTVILEHIDYLLKLERKQSPYGYAAYSISRLKEPLSSMQHELRKIRGVGERTEEIIMEILETGSSSIYEELLIG